MRRCLTALLAGAALAVSAPAARAQVFDFETTPFGEVPLLVTRGGVTATFTSPNNLFAILEYGAGTFAGGASGRVIADVDAIFFDPLEITFSRPLTQIALDFALQGFLGGTALTFEAFLGAVPVDLPVVASGGAPPPGFFFLEGGLTFASTPFDRVVLSSDAVDFAIDNISVTPSAIPEPATLGLVAAGLALVAGVAARRRRSTPQADRRTAE